MRPQTVSREDDANDREDLTLTLGVQYCGTRARDIVATPVRDRPQRLARFYDDAADDLDALGIITPPKMRLLLRMVWGSGELKCMWSAPPREIASLQTIQIRIQNAQRRHRVLRERSITRLTMVKGREPILRRATSSPPRVRRSASSHARPRARRTIDDVLQMLNETSRKISGCDRRTPTPEPAKVDYAAQMPHVPYPYADVPPPEPSTSRSSTYTAAPSGEEREREHESDDFPTYEMGASDETKPDPSAQDPLPSPPSTPHPCCTTNPDLSPPEPPHRTPEPAKDTCMCPSPCSCTHEQEIAQLRAQLARESAARGAAERACGAEHARRLAVQRVLEDVRRERAEPVVVPALMEAFVKLVEMSDALVAEGKGTRAGSW